MRRLVEAIKICYRHCWGEIDSKYLEIVHEICREEGVNIAGCRNSNEIVKRIFSFLKNNYSNGKEQMIEKDENVLNINDYRRNRYQKALDKLMDKTNIDLVLYNILARELLKFRYNRLEQAPITQLIDDEEACSEEVIFIGIIGSLCKQYFAYGINDGFNKYPNGDLVREKFACMIEED